VQQRVALLVVQDLALLEDLQALLADLAAPRVVLVAVQDAHLKQRRLCFGS